MNCPYCGFVNASGSELCESCDHTLVAHERINAPTRAEHRLLEDTIEHLLPLMPITVAIGTPVAKAMQIMCERNIGAVLVTAGGALVGIFTERDALLKIAGRPANTTLPVDSVMTPSPECLHLSDTVSFALHKIAVGGYRHIPIVDAKQKLVGIISVKDLLHYFQKTVRL